MTATLVPGPAVFTAIKNGSQLGFKRSVIGVTGNAATLLTLSFISAIGLGAIILSSAVAFSVMKLAGGAYLIYLGIKAWRSASSIIPMDCITKNSNISGYVIFRESYLVGLSNPKAISFVTALFPQFISAENPIAFQLLALSLVFAFNSFVFLSLYAAMSAKISVALSRLSIQRWLHRLTGGVFVGFGIALASSTRI